MHGSGDMGYYKYLKKSFGTEESGKEQKKRLMEWRRQPAVIRIERPTNTGRARSLGYKSKTGFVLARGRVKKGGRRRPKPSGGRKPRRSGKYGFFAGMNKRAIAERKVSRKYPNLEVLNSYEVGDDGKRKWFEVILVDPSHPAIKKDKDVKILRQKRRTFRGLTSAGKKSRGLQ